MRGRCGEAGRAAFGLAELGELGFTFEGCLLPAQSHVSYVMSCQPQPRCCCCWLAASSLTHSHTLCCSQGRPNAAAAPTERSPASTRAMQPPGSCSCSFLPPPPAPPPPLRPLRLLTLGDGNLSWSLALLRHYCPSRRERARLPSHSPPAASIALACSVYESEAELATKYPETAQGTLSKLRRRGAEVLFNIDATHIAHSVAAERKRQKAEEGRERTGRTEDGRSEAAAVPAERRSEVTGPVDSQQPSTRWDVLVFQHPHSGREDVLYHRRLVSHFLHSAYAVSHRSTRLLLTLCDKQPAQWRVAESAQRLGWQLCDAGTWEAEMEAWTALGYESKRHHTGRQFNSHHVTLRHKLSLQPAHSHVHTEHEAGVHAQQQPHPSLQDAYPLLLQPALPYTEEQSLQLTRAGENATETEAALAALGESSESLCAVCLQLHGADASRVAPRAAEEGVASCERCQLHFTSQRGLQQHERAMSGRDDHIPLQQGEGKRSRHRKLRQDGVVTQAMSERGERLEAKRRLRREAHSKQQTTACVDT